VEPPVSYLESTVPAAAYERAISIRSADRACFARCVRSLRSPSSSYVVSSGLTPLWEKKGISGDELDARARANGYQREAHREEDSRRDGNKHGDGTKKSQGTLSNPSFPPILQPPQ
jgi:hypothetical protein